MALSDLVAQHIMGEINDLTKKIDGQVAVVNESSKLMLNNITKLDNTVSIVSALPNEVAKKCALEVDKYATAAASSAQSLVSAEMAKTMHELVGTAKAGIKTAADGIAASARAEAISYATKILAGGLFFSAIVFSASGYFVKSGFDASEISDMKEKVKSADDRIASVRAEAQQQIANADVTIKFFNCDAKYFEVITTASGKKVCTTKKPTIWQSITGNYERIEWPIR